MNTRLGILLGLLVLVLVGCGKEPEPVEEVLRPVRTESVTATGGKRVRTFSGSARAGVESKLSFRVAGTIERLSVELGDRVNAGTVIAELDPTDYKLQVDEGEAGLRQAQAQARNASANYERIRGLYENNNVSINDLDASRAAMESAKAQVQSLNKRLELARSQLGYTRLEVPVTGSIAGINAEVNENVSAGQPIVILNAGSRPETTFLVPEQLISEIKRGDAVTVRFDALDNQEYDATITEVGVASGDFSTTYPVTARLNKPNDQVRQGMASEVNIIFGAGDDRARIYVRPKAVVEDDAGRHVFVAEDRGDGTAVVRRREVTVGSLTSDGLEVLSGLETGDLVITAGTRFLEVDMIVKFSQGI